MTTAQLEHRLSQNAASPVFARLADDYLSQGKIAEARALCVSGLEYFPSYPTAYLVLSKCLEAQENFSAAREVISLARKILPSLPFFQELEATYTAKLSPDEAALLAIQTSPTEPDIVESPVAEPEFIESPVAEAQSVESPVAEAQSVESPVAEAQSVESPVAEGEIVESPVVEPGIDEGSTANAEIPAVELPTGATLEESAPVSDESADPFGPIPELTIDGLDLPETKAEAPAETLLEIKAEEKIDETRSADDGGVGMSAFFENRVPPRADDPGIAMSEPELTENEQRPVDEKIESPEASSPEIVTQRAPELLVEDEKATEIPSAPAAAIPMPPVKIEHTPLSPTPEEEGDSDLSESASFEAGGRIVSRTLAEIYAIQGAYAEAILTFSLLMQERPEFRKECEARIRDLEAKMQSKPI